MLTKAERSQIFELVHNNEVGSVDIGERKDYTNIWIHMERNSAAEDIMFEISEVFEGLDWKDNSSKVEGNIEKSSHYGSRNGLYIYVFCEFDLQEQQEAV